MYETGMSEALENTWLKERVQKYIQKTKMETETGMILY